MSNSHEDKVARVGALDNDPWMLTATGLKVFFLHPEADTLNLGDVAQHCGSICRFTGAVSQFYSVAQHSVMVGKLIKSALDDEGVDRESSEYWNQILAGLMHDAEEAYVNDLSSPLKVAVGGKYNWIATGIRRKLFERYKVPWAYYNKTVKDADNIAILIERFHFMPAHPDWPGWTAPEAAVYDKPPFEDPKVATHNFKMALTYALEMRNQAVKNEMLDASEDDDNGRPTAA